MTCVMAVCLNFVIHINLRPIRSKDNTDSFTNTKVENKQFFCGAMMNDRHFGHRTKHTTYQKHAPRTVLHFVVGV